MRYRALSAAGDSTFGSGSTAFFVNDAQAVAQLILTRLLLMTGEWFLDVTEGTPYSTQIIGVRTTSTYDSAIKNRILGTEGVVAITAYSSFLNRATRALAVNATVSTIFGQVQLNAVIPPFNNNPPAITKWAVSDRPALIGITDGNQIMTVS